MLFRGHTVDQAAPATSRAVYIGMPLGMLVAVQGAWRTAATLLLIGTVVVSDSMQYYTGRLFGRHPLAPAISPKKTIEGAIGGVVCSARCFMTLAGRWVFPRPGLVPLAMLGLTIVVPGHLR